MDFQVIQEAIPEILTQLIAFLLVFWVLKKYAFGAVFNILEARQKTIAASLSDAEQKKNEMEKLKKDYEDRVHKIELEAREKIQAAIQDGERIAQGIRSRAQEDAQVQLERAKKEIEREVEKARAVMRLQIVNLGTLMAEKLVKKNLKSEENEKFIEEILAEAGESA